MDSMTTDVCILGGGSGGLVVASAAAQFGVQVVLIENRKMGGECLNYGCVPSKSLISVAHLGYTLNQAKCYGFSIPSFSIDTIKVHQYIQSVIQSIAKHDSVERFESLGVKVLQGKAEFTDPNVLVFDGKTKVKSKYFVIATGSSPIVPAIEGLTNVPFLTNENIFDLKEKVEHLLVLGGGPVGCELAQAYRLLGSKVTLLARSHLLTKDDVEWVYELKKVFVEQGIKIYEDLAFESVSQHSKTIEITFKQHDERQLVQGSHVLVATGRIPNVKNLNLRQANIAYDKSGINVNSNLRTTNKRIFAIGDVIKSFKFTHVASYHAGLVIQNILFKRHKKVNYHTLPWITYTTPQLAHIGLTENQALKLKGQKRIIVKKFNDNDHAQTEGETIGGIKLMTTKGGKVLGVSILGHQVDNFVKLVELSDGRKYFLGESCRINHTLSHKK